MYAAEYPRFAEDFARIANEVPGGEVVRAVYHQVVAAYDVQGVVHLQPELQRLYFDLRIEVGEPALSGRHLRLSQLRSSVNHLPLQVSDVDRIVVYDAYPANSRRCEVQQGWRAEAACSHHEDRGLAEQLLPLGTYLW